MDSFWQQFDKFIHAKYPRNIWLEELVTYAQQEYELRVYTRKSRRYIDDQMHEVFDIASISILPAGTGFGTQLIAQMHARHPYAVTYIESIVNPRFQVHLQQLGWQVHAQNNLYLFK